MKKIKIRAKPNHADRKKRFLYDIDIVLGDEIESDYDVVEKDFPDDLPDSWTDTDDKKVKKITWISNFGLKKPDGKFEEKLPKGRKYQVELPKGSGKFVYFDGTRVRKLKGKAMSKNFVADMDLGDPPIGETT